MQRKFSGRWDAFNNEESFGLKEINNVVSEESPYKVNSKGYISIIEFTSITSNVNT